MYLIRKKFYASNYCSYIYWQTGFKFHLTGVISKFWEFGINEYYIAFCKSPLDDKSYQYNNDFVSKVNNLKNEIIDAAEPNGLVYQKGK